MSLGVTIEKKCHCEYLKYNNEDVLSMKEFSVHSNNFYIYFWMKDGEIFPLYAKEEQFKQYLDRYPDNFAKACDIVTRAIESETNCSRVETIKKLNVTLYAEYERMREFYDKNSKLFH